MKSKHLLVLLAVLAAVIVGVGCSSVTQAPQVKIVRITPNVVAASADSAEFTITFRNYNKIDAILNTVQYVYSGPVPPYTLTMQPVRMSFYLPGGSDSVTMQLTVSGVNNTRALIGSPGSCILRFWGSDAYGYNKTFSDSTSFGF